ncbi:hypothetical protein HMI56_003073 [Coelomomyces lativittatus]|nr:hypothetical protein HMI56_003073 [Coelomomyces lativittatus]
MSTSSPNNSFKRKSLSTKPQPSSCTKKSTRPDLIPLIFDDPFLEEEQEGEKVFCSKTVEKELKKDIQPDSMDWLETQYSLLHAMDTHDVDNLRTFGLQSGFQTLSLRRKVWPLLLKLDFNVHKWPSTPQTHTEVSNVTPLKSSKIGTVSPIKQPQLSPSLLHKYEIYKY